MMNEGMFTSNTDEWATPPEFFNKLNDEFHFTLDVCANKDNHKCPAFYTKEQDGLSQPWVGRVWCNPPYGRQISQWIRRAWLASAVGNLVVMLVPARTDTRWFHDYIYQKPNVDIRFVKGRLKFGDSKNSAPFPSMVVIFNPIIGGDTMDSNFDRLDRRELLDLVALILHHYPEAEILARNYIKEVCDR